jgi:hypothetical protein
MPGLDEIDIWNVATHCKGEPPQPQPQPEKAAAVNHARSEVVSTSSRQPQSSGELFVDIETAPDYSRESLFNLPPIDNGPPVSLDDELLSADEFISQELKAAEEYLAKKRPQDSWLAAVLSEEEKQKKPRAGLRKLIAETRSRIAAYQNAAADRVKLLSVTPLYCRIVAIAFARSSGPIDAFTAEDPAAEKDLLQAFWTRAKSARPLVGFNVRDFDLRVIALRSLLLGVHPSRAIDWRKYGSADVLDLMHAIHGDRCPAGFGLKHTARILGITVPDDHGDGAQVYQLVENQQWDALKKYCAGDVEITRNVWRAVAGYLC